MEGAGGAMSELPIGYWLKHLDRLIENDFERVLAADSLRRRHWQVLRSLCEQEGTVTDLDRRLVPFLDEDEGSVAPVVDQLRERGWVEGSVDLKVTAAGRQAHQALFAKIQQARQRITKGIDDEEYRATVDVLARMSANLEPG